MKLDSISNKPLNNDGKASETRKETPKIESCIFGSEDPNTYTEMGLTIESNQNQGKTTLFDANDVVKSLSDKTKEHVYGGIKVSYLNDFGSNCIQYSLKDKTIINNDKFKTGVLLNIELDKK